MTLQFPIRKECPPGACVCHRERLLDDPRADLRVLRLTQEEEKKLIARIDAVSTLSDLRRMMARMGELLGIAVDIRPSERGVRTVRGFQIEVAEQDGLCRKTRQSIPAAIRRCLDRHPEIAFAILDAHDLLGGLESVHTGRAASPVEKPADRSPDAAPSADGAAAPPGGLAG